MRIILNLRHLVILFALLCTACGTAVPSIKPFKLDVQQGNVVTSKMLLQLRPGMTKSQVRFIMGSPLIQDSFHGNRWDYAYQLRENGKLKEQRRVILDFENDVLKTVRGDVVPAGSEAAKALNDEISLTSKKEAEEKSFINKLKFWDKGDAKPGPAVGGTSSSDPVATQRKGGSGVTSQVAAPDALMPGAASVIEPTPAPTSIKIEDAFPASNPAVIGPSESNVVGEDSGVTVAPDANDSPSILAVPLVMPMPTESTSTGDVKLSDPPAVQKPVIPSPLNEAPADAQVIMPAAPVRNTDTESNVIDLQQEFDRGLPAEVPENAESVPNLVFDRDLNMTPVEAAEAEKLRLEALRDRAAPKSEELPPETDPSFFDRMLQRIGF